MKSRAFILTVVVLLGTAGGPAVATESGATVGAAGFVEAALRGIGARETACPTDVVREIESRAMSAHCARFDGNFSTFRDRWAEWTGAAEPQTGWSVSGVGLAYDRVYALRGQALGVRFTRGEILTVYSPRPS